jgi:hypothetical protein
LNKSILRYIIIRPDFTDEPARLKVTPRACSYVQIKNMALPAIIETVSLTTLFEKRNLVLLGELHEAGKHLGELDDLLDDAGQLLGRGRPQLLRGLEKSYFSSACSSLWTMWQ